MKRSSFLKTLFILLAVLFLAVLGSLSVRALEDFYSYKKALKMEDLSLNWDRFLFFLKKEIKYEYIDLKAKKVLKNDKSPLKTFEITINPKDLQKLNSNLPKSGKSFVNAYLKISGENRVRKVKLRYRGDNNFHWLYPQKSLRIKLQNGDLYDMQTQFNLINPPNWYSFRDVVVYDFAKKLGLMAPDFYPVRVFINGKFMGVYLFLSQVDESLLRRFKRMPGSIYYGDYGEPDSRGVSNLWFDPNNWVKKAARNAEQKYDRSDINYLIDAVDNFDKDDFHNFFEKMINKKRFYTFFALDVIFGSDHHDYHHNHKIYFDPYLGRYEPIEWDLRNWSDEKIKDLSVYPLLNRVKLDPVFEAERDKRAYEILKSLNFSPSSLLKEYKKVFDLVYRDLESDRFRDTAIVDFGLFKDWVSVPFTMREFKEGFKKDAEILENRFKFLKRLYEDVRVSYKIDGNRVIFKVEGNSPAVIESKSKERILYPKRKVLKNAQNSRSRLLFGADLIVNAPAFYEFNLSDLNISNLKIKNYITGKKIEAKQDNFSSGLISPFSKKKTKKRVILSGVIDVNKTRVYEDDVLIKNGTVFRIKGGKSLYFYGDLKIEDGNETTIFKPMFNAKPWGIVAVWSKKADISKVKVFGGSVDMRNLVHFTAPLSIHNVKDFKAAKIKIGRNYKGDDAMHIAYSKALVKDSLFNKARSDGLDIDISKVVIEDCNFTDSGNDGLDVMTTKISVKNSIFKGNGDKGISVGEWSDMNLSDSIFIENVIGLEIKDKSRVFAKNLIFVDQKDMAIHLYNKNRRYDEGGFLKAFDITLIGNKKVVKDKKSFYEITFSNRSFDRFKKDFKVFENRGHALFAKGDFEKAAKEFLRSISFKEDNKTISKKYRYAANAFMKAGKNREGVENYALALKYDSSNKNAFYPLKLYFASFKSDKDLYMELLNYRPEILEIIFKNRAVSKNIFYFNTYEDRWSQGRKAKVALFSLKSELKRVKFFILNKARIKIKEDGKIIFDSFINTSLPQTAYFKAKKGFTEVEFETDRVCVPKKCGFNNDLRELGVHIDIENLKSEEREEFEKGLKYFYQNSYKDRWSRGKMAGVWVYTPKIGDRVYLRYSGGDLLKKDIFVKISKNFHYYDHLKLKPKEIRFEEIGLDQGINFITIESNETKISKGDSGIREVGLKYKIVKEIE